MSFFGFSMVKWLQYTGKVGKCISCWGQIFSGVYAPKIIKIGYFLCIFYDDDDDSKNKKLNVFWDTV